MREHKEAFDRHYLEKGYDKVRSLSDALRKKENPKLVKNYYVKFCKRLYDNLEIEDGDRVLGAGCGAGFDLMNLKKNHLNASFYGFDVSEVMVKTASRMADCSLVIAAGENIPFRNESFSNVYSREVIEHVVSPVQFTKEMARVTRKNGIVIITTPNDDALICGRNFRRIVKKLKKKGDQEKIKLKDERSTLMN